MKGIAWCATHNNIALLFSQAGSSVKVEPLSYWVASLPKERQEEVLDNNPEVKALWHPKYGDRHTKLVFIGMDIDVEKINRGLEECVLTEKEMNEDWEKLSDPFNWTIPNYPR